ncbi:TMAO reductase system periplasmic protein TorT [Shewanella abyssi]|uniref:TMAO reductase system periplasmic protein TorT n=1 Tax=Shewanella abyssi TaxID=311789 RepID=UPI0020101D5D|nr:TMAO reductase system periplasmic protein TorT [Shewanella abyssi]MCL1051511.1 TMAO reductase system periplasmic protein TorT [Shewanella abyssi]
MAKPLLRWTKLFLTLLLASPLANAAITVPSWSLEQRQPFDNKIQQSTPLQFTPLTQAKKDWRICVLMPHLKDSYWTGINYGLVQQAKKLKLHLELFEAGSYYGLDKQLSQLDNCMKHDFDAILLGGVRPDLLDFYKAPIDKPIIALVNRLDHKIVTTRVGVNWYQMGFQAGEYIRQQTDAPTQVALLAGPDKQGGSGLVEQGLRAALADSQVTISAVRHADNNRNLYRDELEALLDSQTPQYILGSAVAIEAGVAILRQRQLEDKVKLVSSYLSPAILRGIYRDRVEFSNDDLVVVQGMLAIDVAVRELQGARPFGDIGPKIQSQIIGKINKEVLKTSLAPADYYPIYRVNPED